MTSEPKPVVTQVDVARAIEVFEGSRPSMLEIDRVSKLFAAHRLAHSPSEPSVVTQDLVPVAWMYESVDGHPQVFTERMFGHRRGNTETPLYPASAIEAAQIAARNDALEEAARAVELMGMTEEDRPNPITEWIDAWEMAAEAIRALRSGQ